MARYTGGLDVSEADIRSDRLRSRNWAHGSGNAAWQPAKPIEFIATAGPGGGTDNFARAVQNIITKYKLVEQPIVVVNKAGGSGAEGYTYTKAMAGDPYKIVFGTSNAWTQPMVSKVAYNYTDLTPIAAMVQDEFLLWVKQDAPYQNVQDFIKAVAAKPAGDFKMGGAQSKDTDETLTRMIDKAAKVKFVYIPFKSGAEAAVQLAGGHIDAHVNNPSESIGQWKGSTQRPLCAFSPQRLPDGPKVTATQNWHDIPTCVEVRPCHSAVPAAPHGLAAGKGDRRSGHLLCRPDEEGAGHAGMEGIYRADVADRHLPDRRCLQQVHQGRHRTHPQGGRR